MRLRWARRSPDSHMNFDLLLLNPRDLDVARMHLLLEGIVKQSHRGLTLNGRAVAEFKRFFDNPDTPLKAYAYVLLSNWFLTRSGDKNSEVATRCEALWDELFPCRPLERLSSPAPGENHLMLDSEFQSFWSRLQKASGVGETASSQGGSSPTEIPPSEAPSPASKSEEVNSRSLENVVVTFVRDGQRFEINGSPQAMAEFLQH
jgi:hypothetical protein